MFGKQNVRVRFIIAEQYIVARLIFLDVIVLQQQGFCFGMGNGGFNMGNL